VLLPLITVTPARAVWFRNHGLPPQRGAHPREVWFRGRFM
jgi:hypothetical protein